MIKFEVCKYARGDEPKIRTLEITRETEHSYWTARTPNRWDKSTEQIHQKRANPIHDTFEQAKAELVSLAREKVRDYRSRIEMYQRFLAEAEKELIECEAVAANRE